MLAGRSRRLVLLAFVIIIIGRARDGTGKYKGARKSGDETNMHEITPKFRLGGRQI